MNRRRFLAESVRTGVLFNATLPGATTQGSRAAASIHVSIDAKNRLQTIPANFVGLGYEISSVPTTGLLSADNHAYVQLVRTLGRHGVIRVGGNTSDYAAYSREGAASAAPKATVVNERNLRDLGTFLEATGWDLIWGLNLGRGTVRAAVEEARAVARNVKEKLLAFEIGNEPDLFRRVHREQGYGYDDYLKEYRHFKAAIQHQLPNVGFAGPDAAGATDWVSRFASDEGRDLKLLTHHYYRECANATSSCDKLLKGDRKLDPELQKLRSASESWRVPYRICETNSFCGGGKRGVSNTFCSALWALDFMFILASGGAAGLNMETGLNQLGFISSYSPLGDDKHGSNNGMPEYYGMLAFAQASQGRLLSVHCNSAGMNLSAYAVADEQAQTFVTVINKETSIEAEVTIDGLKFAGVNATRGRVLRMIAPSLESTAGVMLGGSQVAADGKWNAAVAEAVPLEAGECRVRVPAASAAILILK